jgi:chromosomal replication initiator protein
MFTPFIHQECFMKAIWQDIKARIQCELPKNTFSLWIQPISFVETDEQTVILNCPNKFSRNWVMENYFDLIKDKFHKAGAEDVELIYKPESQKKDNQGAGLPAEPRQLAFANIGGNGGVRLNTDYTFDRFVVGQCNEFAYSASRALAHGSPLSYRCLLMLANTGLGKSHLSHAIGNTILEHNPRSRLYYMTAEDFTNEMICSLKANRIEAFKDKYRRRCDVLLLEEIHFLSGKQKTQLELGYTLDALANDNRSIILTSALAPKDIPSMSGELSSRLTSGLVTAISGPDFDTRVKILTKKACEYHLVLSEQIIQYLASRLTRDIRQMESALKSLKARAELVKARIDLDLAKEVVNCLVSGEQAIGLDEIRELVCRYYKIEPGVLQSKSRKKTHATPRNIYVYLCRRHTDETIQAIARTINRSHSTVLYASEIVGHKMKTDQKMCNQVEFLGQKLEKMKT